MGQIITIGREFGSGGREFGRRLAEELGYKYIDQEILSKMNEKTSMSENMIHKIMDRNEHSLFPITIAHTFSSGSFHVGTYNQMQELYSAQFETIREVTNDLDCVIVGRCADFILRDKKPLRFFIYADMDSKVKRTIAKSENPSEMNEKEVEKMIRRIDKNRAKYYEDFTGKEWGGRENYDILVNTSNVNIKELVPIFAKLVIAGKEK